MRAFLDWWFRPDEHPPAPGDEALERASLYSVEAFLTAWNRHLDACRAALPATRTLALRTHELARAHARLCAENMRRHFPEVGGLDQAIALWEERT